MLTTSITIFLFLAFILANIPWLTEKMFGLIKLKQDKKPLSVCFLEWLILYFVTGLAALGLEKKFTAELYSQDWEFYAVTICLFGVFALPGFLYRFELKHLLQRATK